MLQTVLVSLALPILAALGYWAWRALARPSGTTHSPTAPKATASEATHLPHRTAATDAVNEACLRLAFSVPSIDHRAIQEHAAVLAQAERSIEAAIHQPEFFPRRPKLLPKLMHAINDADTTRDELVRLILEDPTLAANVLQRANSAFYRRTPAPVDSLDRAVVHLGLDGLRSLLGTALLQPVFRQPKGHFDQFATLTWERAQRAAAAGETYAKSASGGDPFVAQMLCLILPLAHLVLFRLLLNVYREHPTLQPRAEVFIHLIQTQGARVAGLIAASWELSDPSLLALSEQARHQSPTTMSAFGRAVYYGSLCGDLAVLEHRSAYSRDDAIALLVHQGAHRDDAHLLWRATRAVLGDA